LKKTLFVLLGFVLVLSLLLAACGGTETTTATSKAPATTAPATTKSTTAPVTTAPTTPAAPAGEKYGGVFKVAIAVAPATPIGYPPEGSADSYTLNIPAVERLAQFQTGGAVEGVLATSWDVAADGKSITLHLRKGVKFHDGSDFNADVCKWNLSNQMAAKNSETTSWTSIDKIDDYTIRINLSEYTNMVVTSLASGFTGQVSKAYIEKNGIEAARWNPVGTGPFMFSSYERDAKLTYKRNPNYWRTGLPYLDGITMTVIADETVRKLAFLKGDTHAFEPLTLLTSKELKDTGKYSYKSRASGPYVLVPDSMNPKSPWSDVRVRYAASYALDRTALAGALGFGLAIPSYQMRQAFPEYNIAGLVHTDYDPVKAKALLKDAGYPNGFKTTIHGFTRSVPADYIKALAEQLRKVGIEVETDFPTAAKYSELRYGTWDGMLAHGFAAFDNPNKDFTFYFTGLQFHYCKKPAGWDEGLKASLASQEVNPQLIKNLIQIVYDDMMVIPYMEQPSFLFTPKGVNDDANGKYPHLKEHSPTSWEYVWIDKSLR
jgi:peptide/nickel transport system substrate-binding protein